MKIGSPIMLSTENKDVIIIIIIIIIRTYCNLKDVALGVQL